ncbi:MAG: ABC transporter permease subunit, partial [Streptosporangiaceae bacterium]
GLTVLIGLSGQISLGNGASMAIGAYATALLQMHLGWPLWALFPASAGIAAVFGAAVGVAAAVLAAALGLALLFRYTSAGLRLRAAAFNAYAARLLGVRVGRVLTLGWALAGLIGALAGVLVSPATFLYPASMDSIFVLGFTAAVIGGLDSPVGAVVGGLILGVALNYVGGYLGSNLVPLFGLAALIVVLMIRPSGLFSASTGREV